mmetsp:Transcript_22883/g.74546  ORF Transcript_22883/g.74546 Transcript_22883/m.74546 type:complete len:251 (-) Transcript_22883:324-1076(-)
MCRASALRYHSRKTTPIAACLCGSLRSASAGRRRRSSQRIAPCSSPTGSCRKRLEMPSGRRWRTSSLRSRLSRLRRRRRRRRRRRWRRRKAQSRWRRSKMRKKQKKRRRRKKEKEERRRRNKKEEEQQQQYQQERRARSSRSARSTRSSRSTTTTLWWRRLRTGTSKRNAGGALARVASPQVIRTLGTGASRRTMASRASHTRLGLRRRRQRRHGYPCPSAANNVATNAHRRRSRAHARRAEAPKESWAP